MRADLSDWSEEAALYFNQYADGRYHEAAYLQYIYPLEEARLTEDGGALIFGSAGADGLEFAFRPGSQAVWVHFPIDGEWREIAPDLDTFDKGWCDGTIKV